MGLLDQFFYGGMQAQADPNMQEAALTDLFRRLQPAPQPQPQPQQAPAAAPRQAPALPEPNFLDRLSALSRGYDKGGLVGGIADAVNLGNSYVDRAAQQQEHQTLQFLLNNDVDPQTAQAAIRNPNIMKELLPAVMSRGKFGDPSAQRLKQIQLETAELGLKKAKAPEREKFETVDGVPAGVSYDENGQLVYRRLEGGTAAGPALPGTIEGAPKYKGPKEVADVSKGLRGDYEGSQLFKNHATTAEAYNKIGSALASQSTAGDIAATYAFMKMMDPNSVVRESEFMMLGNSGSLPDKIQRLFTKAATGEGLTPDMRADIAAQAKKVYENSQKLFSRHQDNYRGIARSFYIDPATVVYDIEGSAPAAAAPPPNAAPQAAPPQLGVPQQTPPGWQPSVPKGPDPRPAAGWSVQRVR